MSALPGNPYVAAGSMALTSRQHTVAAATTLALAYELRTANLIALYGAIQPATDKSTRQLFDLVLRRLDLDPEATQ